LNHLVYGKNNQKNIVSIEVIDDTAEIFLESEDGSLNTMYVPNSYWILSNEPQGSSWVKLAGDLHYKYGKKFKKATDLYKEKAFLKNRGIDFYCVSDAKESLMLREGYTYFKGMEQKSVSVLSFDIETTSLEHDDTAKILIISNTIRKNGQIKRRLFTYDEYEDEGKMLEDWCEWVRNENPSIIVGHNIYTYDFPYMQFIADKYGVELLLGRNGSPITFFNYESQKRIDGSRKQAYHKVRIYGREVIDTMFLAINYDIGKKYESYALKKIIAQEGLEIKDRQFYNASTIRTNYLIPEEWEKIKKYALHDADDSLALYDLMSPSFFYLAQSVPKSFQAIVESASGSQLNSMMIRAYIQEGHSLPKESPAEKYEGAISFGNPGIYRNCFKVDVASLYPSIMIHYEVYDRDKDPKGYMRDMVKIFTEERLKNKKLAKETGIKYYDDMQNAQKIVINSFYGFLGAEGLLFNSPKNAAFVTEKGREILQKAIKWAIGYELIKQWDDKGEDFDWIVPSQDTEVILVNCDTDSITFAYKDGRDLTEEQRKDLIKDLNSKYPDRIRFEDDGYYKTIIVLKAKNYILYDGKKIKTKGSSLKDAKKEKALKEFMFKIVEAIIDGRNNYADIYQQYVLEAANIKDISRWASKKTISKKVLTNDRTNEARIREAIEGEEIVEGDKVYMYFKSDGTLALADKFDGDYNKAKMLEKVYKTALTFENVIPKETFINYKLKKNIKLLGLNEQA
jgi:DNA polymerase I